MIFLELFSAGRKIWINAARIKFFERSSNGTMIFFEDGKSIIVSENPMQILALIPEPRQ